MPEEPSRTEQNTGNIAPRRLAIFLLAALIVVVILYRSFVLSRPEAYRPQPQPPASSVDRVVPPFILTSSNGQPISLRDLNDSYWIACFFFTACPGPCLKMSQQMETLQALLANKPEVKLVSISVDPKNDTPIQLSRYAERFHADPKRWLFLTGDPRQIYQLASKGFLLPVSGSPHDAMTAEGPLAHSTKFILVGKSGQIRRYFDGLDKNLAEQVQQALAEEGA